MQSDKAHPHPKENARRVKMKSLHDPECQLVPVPIVDMQSDNAHPHPKENARRVKMESLHDPECQLVPVPTEMQSHKMEMLHRYRPEVKLDTK
jgi:hypothetical protein